MQESEVIDIESQTSVYVKRHGNIVNTPFGVVAQFFSSLFRYKTLDTKWTVVWLYEPDTKGKVHLV